MNVNIENLESSIDVVDDGSMLSPSVIERIVQAVIREMERRESSQRIQRSELDLRSVVDQQRRGER